MAEVTVKLKSLRMAPRKVRRVVALVRGKSVVESLHQLDSLALSAARPVSKLLKSALVTAKDQHLDEDQLWISSVRCDQGPALKRWRPRARGRTSQLRKFISHITLSVGDVPPKARHRA